MSTTHDFFATTNDLPIIHDWLHEAGGVPYGYSGFDDVPVDGREIVIHFPAIGPIEFWPDNININDFEENSSRWKRAVLAKIDQEGTPGRRQVDADRSATAGLLYPELRDKRYWVSGSLWFPTSRLRQTFPELAKVCQRFERFLQRYTLALDARLGKNEHPFGEQLCLANILHRVFALPDAAKLLASGGRMVEHLVSPRKYGEFKRSQRQAKR